MVEKTEERRLRCYLKLELLFLSCFMVWFLRSSLLESGCRCVAVVLPGVSFVCCCLRRVVCIVGLRLSGICFLCFVLDQRLIRWF